jgi:hypothetical protein
MTYQDALFAWMILLFVVGATIALFLWLLIATLWDFIQTIRKLNRERPGWMRHWLGPL